MTPDLLCFAKGVTSGAVPMGGVIARESVYDAFMHGPEHAIELFHGYTYSAHPLACAAGLATLDLYRDEDLFERARRLEPLYADAAMTLKGLPGVLDIRAIGIAAGIDLAPRPGAPGERGYEAMERAFHDEDLVIRITGDTLACRPAADRQRGGDRRDIREGRPRHSRGGLVRYSSVRASAPADLRRRSACGH